jgi:hypothetical protein
LVYPIINGSSVLPASNFPGCDEIPIYGSPLNKRNNMQDIVFNAYVLRIKRCKSIYYYSYNAEYS